MPRPDEFYCAFFVTATWMYPKLSTMALLV